MIILGIDCSTKRTNVGVAEESRVLGEINLELGRAQSSQLPLMAEKLLADLNIALADIDLVAVTNGPGYYTGIRTGVSYSAALAEALSIKAVPLSSLELLAFSTRDRHTYLAPVINAKRGHVYGAVFSSSGTELKTEREQSFFTADGFAEILKKYPEAVIIGDDCSNHTEFSTLKNRRMASRTSGGTAALMGYFYRDKALSPASLRGVYLRDPDIGPTR